MGEVLDRHGDEHRVGGEQCGAVIGGGGRLEVQLAAVDLPDVGADAQGPVQRDGGEVVDGEGGLGVQHGPGGGEHVPRGRESTASAGGCGGLVGHRESPFGAS